jgi:outer membrane lipoprotein carrier protein
MKRRLLLALAWSAGLTAPTWAQSNALEQLTAFQREVQSGRVNFTQVVVSPDGKKRRSTQGSFEFLRPNRFRFDYQPPEAQTLIGDGKKVWLIDPELMQASSRPMSQVVSATPVAILAGTSLGEAFVLKAEPEVNGVAWVAATPKQADAGIQRLRIGLKGKLLAAMEIVDGLGQKSTLSFGPLEVNVPLAADRFQFVPSKGMDVVDGGAP